VDQQKEPTCLGADSSDWLERRLHFAVETGRSRGTW
jgi:hypothetical protein